MDIRKLFRSPAGTLAAAAAFVAIGESKAHAQTTIGSLASSANSQVSSIGNFVIEAGFLAGVYMVFMGLMKLKQASDDGGQRVKYADGFWRILIGGGLCALPAVTGVSVGSIFSGSPGASAQMGSATFTN